MPKPRNSKNKAKKKTTGNTEPCASLRSDGDGDPSICKDTPASATSSHPADGPDTPDADADTQNTSDAATQDTPDADADVPCIEPRWNGPRVVDVTAFVASRHAVAPSVDDATCAAYAAPATRRMILEVLPVENGLILWYNKSRRSARICPACRRFYTVGDVLLPHLVDDQSGSRAEYVDPRNAREKRISGLCSLMCFGIASYNWPGAIGAWGKHASEVDAATHAKLQGRGACVADEGMGTVMKLSRVENLLDVLEGAWREGVVLY